MSATFFRFLKPFVPPNRLRYRKGEENMDETDFKKVFRDLIEQYTLTPDAARLLLQRILILLADGTQSENSP